MSDDLHYFVPAEFAVAVGQGVQGGVGQSQRQRAEVQDGAGGKRSGVGIGQGEMPPLFVIRPAGGSELVNYRVRGNYYIVDRLFAAAELRLGDKDSERRVRIVRTDGRPRS